MSENADIPVEEVPSLLNDLNSIREVTHEVPMEDTVGEVNAPETPARTRGRRKAAAQTPIVELSDEERAKVLVYSESIQAALRGGIHDLLHDAKGDSQYMTESSEPESPLFFTSFNERMLGQTMALRGCMDTLKRLIEFRKIVNSVNDPIPTSFNPLVQRLCQDSSLPLSILAMQVFYVLYSCKWADLVAGCRADTEDIAFELESDHCITDDVPLPSTLLQIEGLISSLMVRQCYGIPGGFEMDKLTFQSPSKKASIDVKSGDSFAFYNWESIGDGPIQDKLAVQCMTAQSKLRKEFGNNQKLKLQFIELTLKGVGSDKLDDVEEKIVKSGQKMTVQCSKYRELAEKEKEGELKRSGKEKKEEEARRKKEEKELDKRKKEEEQSRKADEKKEEQARKAEEKKLELARKADEEAKKKKPAAGFMSKFLVKKDGEDAPAKTASLFSASNNITVSEAIQEQKPCATPAVTSKSDRPLFREYKPIDHSRVLGVRKDAPVLLAPVESSELQTILSQRFAERLARRQRKRRAQLRKEQRLEQQQNNHEKPAVKSEVVEAPVKQALLLECRNGVVSVVNSVETAANATDTAQGGDIEVVDLEPKKTTYARSKSKGSKILQFTEETRPNWSGPWPRGLAGFPQASSAATDAARVIVRVRPKAPLFRYPHVNYDQDSELDWSEGSEEEEEKKDGDNDDDDDEDDEEDDGEDPWLDSAADLPRLVISNDEKPGLASFYTHDSSAVEGFVLAQNAAVVAARRSYTVTASDVLIVMHNNNSQLPLCTVEPCEQKKRKFRRPSSRKSGQTDDQETIGRSIIENPSSTDQMNVLSNDMTNLATPTTTTTTITNTTPSIPVVNIVPVRRKIQPQPVITVQPPQTDNIQ